MSVRQTKERIVEGPGQSVKTTTYESKSSYESDGYRVTGRRPGVQQRNVTVHRSGGLGGYGGSSSTMISRSKSSSLHGMSPGSYQLVSSTGVSNVKDTRVQEKKDMQDLNERFASYIEKVRFLEAQNRRLADELEKLKAKWGKETTAIKKMYEEEMESLRKAITEAATEKGKLQVMLDDDQDRMNEMQDKINDMEDSIRILEEKTVAQAREIADKDGDLATMRNTVECMQVERDRNRKEIARLMEIISKLRSDLDNETLAHIEAENKALTLQEELEFLKEVHEQEMKELAALAYRDTTRENREFWKSEMGNALREIQSTYDDKLDAMRGELETYYNLKVQEFRTGSARNDMETSHAKDESKRLKVQLADLRAKLTDSESRFAAMDCELQNLRAEMEAKERDHEMESTALKTEVAKLRAEMEAILKELQDLMDTKLGLELEIAAYRKLLEGEENRVSMRSVMDNIITQGYSSREEQDDSSLKVSQVVKGEMSAKTTYQRSAKGPVSISECSADGKSVAIENTGRKEENLRGWRIQRIVDGSKVVDQIFEQQVILRPGQKIKLLVKSSEKDAGHNDIVFKIDSFGLGANINTRLLNGAEEERATHIQKTVYVS